MARPFSSKAPGSGGFDLPSLSDDEDNSSTTTSIRDLDSGLTVLGYVDGLITSPSSLDWKTSRVGGLPTFPPMTTSPAASAALCGVCRQPMPLLTQIYCPLDDSLFERVVYTFGCPTKACRGKDGSVRAWRAGVLWVEDSTATVEEEVAPVVKEKLRLGDLVFGSTATVPGPVGGAANFNPFAPNPASSAPAVNPFAPASAPSNPFAPALVANSFVPVVAAAPANPFAPTSAPPTTSPPARRSNLDLLTSSFASNSIAPPPEPLSTPIHGHPDPAWLAHPAFPPQYLTTAYEPTPPPSSSISRLPIQTLAAAKLEDVDVEPQETHREGKGSGGRVKKGAAVKPGSSKASGADGWGGEGYEVQKVRGVDDVFLRFQERVAREGLQCVRYAHTSTPLAFSSLSPTYARLFPPTPTAPLGAFDPTRIPRCRHCGSESTFEYQLMPNLVTSLANVGLKGSSAEDKGKAKSVLETDGVEFATVMVFACLRECVGEEGDGNEAWREEQVCLELEVN